MNNVIEFPRNRTNRVTVAEMADLLAVNPETIRRYIRHETVPPTCWVQNHKKEYLIDARAFVAALPWIEAKEIES